MFSPIERYMTKDSFDSLVENKEILSILAKEKGEIIGCCFASMMERSGMVRMKSSYIDLIVVDEQHRNKGVGKAIFTEVQK